MITVPIEGNGGSILIEVFGYENVAASNESDANWLRARIKIFAGPFSGVIDAALTTQDFFYFDRELAEVLRTFKGKAVFQTDEDWLCFEVEMGSLGTANVRGTAKAIGSRSSLMFSFNTDQSYLTNTKRAVAEVTEKFSIRQFTL